MQFLFKLIFTAGGEVDDLEVSVSYLEVHLDELVGHCFPVAGDERQQDGMLLLQGEHLRQLALTEVGEGGGGEAGEADQFEAGHDFLADLVLLFGLAAAPPHQRPHQLCLLALQPLHPQHFQHALKTQFQPLLAHQQLGCLPLDHLSDQNRSNVICDFYSLKAFSTFL